jgi:hypothetical protein
MKIAEFTEFTSGAFPPPELPKRMTAISLLIDQPVTQPVRKDPAVHASLSQIHLSKSRIGPLRGCTMLASAETKAAPKGNKPSRPGIVPGRTARS